MLKIDKVGKSLAKDVRFGDIVNGKFYLSVSKAIFDNSVDDKGTIINGAFDKWRKFEAGPVCDL